MKTAIKYSGVNTFNQVLGEKLSLVYNICNKEERDSLSIKFQ